MRSLKLYFELGELSEVVFHDGLGNEPRVCVRGKTSGPSRSAGSFQWTSAVKALSVMAVRTALNPKEALIQGEGSSLASSLDYAISKQPLWLSEMFGWDNKGVSLARRLILRSNPERKRPGPVTLGFNQLYMPPSAISIYSHGRPCASEQLQLLSAQLEGLMPIDFEQATAA